MITIISRSALLASAAALAVVLNALPASAQEDARAFALIAKITIKAGQEGIFVKPMKAQMDASRAEPGVLAFRVLASSSDPLVFYSFEEYRNKAAFEAHLASADTKRLLSLLKDIQAADLEAQILSVRPRSC